MHYVQIYVMCLSIILFIYCNFNHIIESSSIISHSGQVHIQNCLSSPASPHQFSPSASPPSELCATSRHRPGKICRSCRMARTQERHDGPEVQRRTVPNQGADPPRCERICLRRLNITQLRATSCSLEDIARMVNLCCLL